MANPKPEVLTPQNSQVVFIDHQPQMAFGVQSIDRQTLKNNVVALAKAAKVFKIPTTITSVESQSFSGYTYPELLDVFPDKPVLERTSMNSWDDKKVRDALKANGRNKVVVSGLWVEVCNNSLDFFPQPSPRVKGPSNTEGGARSDMLRREVAEAQLAIHLYTDYFGPAPYQRLALTEQPANNFGQSWPALIYLPAMSFQAIYNSSYNAMTHGFTRGVASHEIAHQWFGHTLGIPSYRDNWLSEGFAHFASSLYLQSVYSDQPDTYRDFLKDWKIELLEKNREGKRAIDVGSVTMGYRLGNTKVGFDVNRLIYDKGGYILHMLRMMMWNPRDKDEAFKVMMRDYVHSYYNRISSTEDFKEVVERHMTREMDQQGNGKMDWFLPVCLWHHFARLFARS
jgi:hypothetical protein